MNPIGVMQGRLSPPADDRLQAFPAGCWSEEFARAAEAGLDCLEWVYEAETAAINPLSDARGIAQIRHLSRQHGVGVWSVCADYYMQRTLLDSDGLLRQKLLDHLGWLIGQAAEAGCRYIVLPFVDSSRLVNREHLAGLARALDSVLPLADSANLEIHLETDLTPNDLAAFLRRVNHPRLKVNLDTGNSASLGYDAAEEIAAIGPWLGSVHIKDRLLHRGSVALGLGQADFPAYFEGLRTLAYAGSFVLQVARSASGDEVAWCRQNRAFVERALLSVEPRRGAA